MNSEIPKYFTNQTIESSICFSIQDNPNKRQALVVCVVFKVDESNSCEADAFIRYVLFIDGISITSQACCCSSKSEYM